jgi:hypothetical protein
VGGVLSPGPIPDRVGTHREDLVLEIVDHGDVQTGNRKDRAQHRKRDRRSVPLRP